MNPDSMIQRRRLVGVPLSAAVPLLCIALAVAAPGQSSPIQTPDLDAPASTGPPPIPLPRVPRGKSSVIGGEIISVNSVRDQFRLKIFGGKTIQVLYDERTQIFRDGTKIGVLTLNPYDHASVETILDGTKIFALRIHMLSQLPEGHCLGTVSQYNPQSGELAIDTGSSHLAIKVSVPRGTPVLRIGEGVAGAQPSDSFDFVQGLVVDVSFKGGSGGQRIATQVNLPASRGSGYMFSGNLSFLDLRSKMLMIANERDGRTYQISFDPVLFPVVNTLQEGSLLRVSTDFDGTRFVATGIALDARPSQANPQL